MNLLLNLGSGQRPFSAPWLNVDSQAKWEPDVCMDAHEYLKSLPDNCADMICLHHVLEHFGCGEGDGLLQESLRVLSTGGSLLVFVPDMLELAHMWIEGRISDQIYMTNIYGAYMSDEADRHKWGFSQQSLQGNLKALGFSKVLKFDWRKIPGADIGRDRWILGLEAVK